MPALEPNAITATSRLEAIRSSLTTTTTAPTTAAMSPTSSSPITCHVLNTLSGTPASSLPATLSLLTPPTTTTSPQPVVSFHATTDGDGRVKEWSPSSAAAGHQSVHELLEDYKQGEKVPFSIKFAVGQWYEDQGVESFWPEVEVKFYVKKGERHYHVPVLLGPWNFSSYRGS
jgi:5-hydroxyisourate hydrolase